MGDQSWDFHCPQYVDFSTGPIQVDDNADSWFDFDHENGVSLVVGDELQEQPPGGAVDEIFTTPNSEVKRVTRSMSALNTPQQQDSVKKKMHESHSNLVPAESNKTPQVSNKTPQNGPVRATRSQAKSTPVVCNGHSEVKVEKDVPVEKKQEETASNICGSLEEWRSKSNRTKPVTQSKRQLPKVPPVKVIAPQETGGNKRQHRSLERSSGPASKKPRANSIDDLSDGAQKRQNSLPRQPVKNASLQRSSSFSQLGPKPPSTRGHVRGYSGERPRSVDNQRRSPRSMDNSHHSVKTAEHSPHTAGANASKIAKLTIPNTPTFMKRQKMKTHEVKSTEEMEMEKIGYFREQLAKKRKQAQESCKLALTATGYHPVTNSKEPTLPQGFQFETDKRLKGNPSDTKNSETPCTNDFPRLLRSDRAKSPASGHKGLTVPKPFNLADSKKRKLDASDKTGEKFESMAERVKAFHRCTPERFRSNPKEKQRGRSKSPQHGLTVPKTPNLECRTRSRPVTAPTREELEEKEVEEMKKNQFKARPVNQKILAKHEIALKSSGKIVTVPEEFSLHTDKRIQERDEMRDKTEEKFEFHAQPVPKKILEGVVGVKPAKPLPLTEAQSPAFALKHRVRLPIEVPEEPKEERMTRSKTVPHHGIPFQPVLDHKATVPEPFTFEEREKYMAAHKERLIQQALEEEEKEEMFKANPVPHCGIPFQPILSHKATEPEPFTFDERDKLIRGKKEEKIHKILEEEKKAREFHANPLPNLSGGTLPPKKVKPATKPEPFHLHSDIRGSKRAEEWSSKVEEELRQQKELASFKAKPSDVLQQKPFIPDRSTKGLTDVTEFELNTARRAVRREAFEMHKKAKEAEIEAVKRQNEKRREAEEQAEVERLRQQSIHKANPVKKFKSVAVHPSEKPLTLPMSPKFSTDTRLRSNVRV